MINKNFKRGLEILSKYADDEDHSLAASHDEITFYTDQPPSDQDQIELLELGWSSEDQYWRAYV